MKRALISLSTVFLVALACEVAASEIPEEGSFDWAMSLVEDYVKNWEPDAHLSSISGTIDRDGLLKVGTRWRLTFTCENVCRTWRVDNDGNVKLSDSPYVTGPSIAFDNLRIQHLLAPVLNYLDDNYVEGIYYFYLVYGSDSFYYSLHNCALIWCDDEWDSHVFNALVDTDTYEIVDITSG